MNVTWHDAVALARWLSATEGRRYRLPTEAEWEYACRAGTSTQYHSGDAPASLSAVANVFDTDAAMNWPGRQAFALPTADGFAFTAPVGQFAPNAFGLHDMHGNVWEWTADWHGATYYTHSPLDDPQGPGKGAPGRVVAHLAAVCALRLSQLEHAGDALHAGGDPTGDGG